MIRLELWEINQVARGYLHAQELAERMKGRPKSFPPIYVLAQRVVRDQYFSVQVIDAEFDGEKVHVLFEDGALVSFEPNERFQQLNPPKEA